MSNIADYWGELPPNLNGLQEWGHGQNMVGGGYTRLMMGKVVGYPHMEAHHITSTYNVSLIDMHDDHGGEIVIHNCSQVLPNAGLDYTGVREPLMDGTPVLVLCKDGVFDQGYIIGCVRLSGDYDDFILKGKVPKPFSVGEGWQGERTANPGPSFPYVVARPEDYVRITPMDNLVNGFGRSEYEQGLKGKGKKRPQPGSIEIRTMGGDVINYTKNTFAVYADRQVIILALSGNETKCTALAQQASYYAERYEALKAAVEAAPNKDEKRVMDNWSDSSKPVGYTKDLSQSDRTSLDWGEPMGVKYHLDELYKLAGEYRKASAACNSESASLSKGIAGVEKSTTPADKADTDKAPSVNTAKPKESKTGTPPQSSRAGIEVDEILEKLGNKAPDAMTIQKVTTDSKTGEKVVSDSWDANGDKVLPMASTIKLQVVDLAINSKLPNSITITQEVLGEGEEGMLGKSYTPQQLVEMALKDSNNTATNALVRAMAGDGGNGVPNASIGNLLKARGYEDTTLANYLSTTVTSAQGKNSSTTNDVSRAMANIMNYTGPMKVVVQESLNQSITPFSGGRTVDGVEVTYNSTVAANSAVIEVDGSQYIVTTTKSGVDGTQPQGDAVSDASIRAAIGQIRGLGTMGGPSNATPIINLSNLEVKEI
ncbi:beta-lactamase enzyme family protein [Microcoleus phage My-WqHQDG]|nr:beta-lactamase enzyme family protein [Microcoleus phage My-WqHQDG]